MENNEYKMMYDIEQTHWWFVGKRFLIKESLKRVDSELLNRGRILDVGCGTGIVLKALKKFGNAYGIEFSLDAIRFLKLRGLGSIVRADINQPLPLKSDKISVITCLDVIEHLDNDENLLKEIYRVCRPGGYMIFTVPAFNIFWSDHDIALHHRRRYTKSQILNKIKEMNCEIIKMSYYNSFLSIPILAYRKFRSMFSNNNIMQSDFFFSLPESLNTTLSLLFMIEIGLLKFINFPFGVSFFFILKKISLEKSDTAKDE